MRSADLALEGWGDQAGYHLDVGRESSGFAWQEVALLRPGGRDESSWTGYQCLSGDGKFAAVAVLPASAVNQQSARDHGAFAYSVDLGSGVVRPLASGVGLKYFSPGCGLGTRAVFTLDVGPDDADTQLLGVDLATGAVDAAITVHDQVTSAVPAAGGIVGVRGNRLVSVSADGRTDALATVTGDAYELRATADGVGFLQTQPGARTADAVHYRAGRTTKLGSGERTRLHLFQGRAGHPVLTGTNSLEAPAVTAAGVVAVTDQALAFGASTASLDGDALAGPDRDGGRSEPAVLATKTNRLLGRPRAQSTKRAATATAAFVATAAATAGVRPGKPEPRGDAAPSTSDKAPSSTTAQTPVCAVSRTSASRQVMQPNPAQVNWAIQMAEQGLLTGSAYTRPAGFANLGLAAFAPNSDFPLIPLSHPAGDSWNTVPRSVYEAIVAQESNWSQASWHSPAGTAGGPLVSDYYGAHGDIRSIDYAHSDCGYGLGQVTTGMHVGDHVYSVNGQTKIAVDYQENIAAGLQILESTWNQLYAAGVTANGGNPRYLENWYFAAWAYNSGIQPNAANGNTTGCTPGPTCVGPHGTWGLGWTNNPANLDYPPSRAPYLKNTYADAAHPASWPYQERVLGWMASPLLRYGSRAYATPDYHGGQTWVQPAPFTSFCTTDNQCDPNATNPTVPGASHCMLNDFQCWWHLPVTWIPTCATTCATSSYAVTTGSTEPANPSQNPPTCTLDTSKVPANSIIVDDEPARLNLQGCGAANWTSNGTFSYAYGTSPAGDPVGAIDTHQLGTGLGGHVLFTHTEDGTEPALINTGTWTPNLPSLQYYKVKLHIPGLGAQATNVVYTINPGGGVSPWRIRVNQAWNSEQWVTIGTFAMTNGGNVVLTNNGSSVDNGGFGNSDFDVAFDAIAFVPQGGTPGQPIGGPPGIQDAPKGSNPAFVNCGCVKRTAGDPVDTVTGYFGDTFTDLSTPGRGVPLNFVRSYAEGIADPVGPNGSLAADGPFGWGWTHSYNLSTKTDPGTGNVTVRQEDGSTVAFVNNSGTYTTAAPRFDATLVKNGANYTYTRRGRTILTFDVATGRLTAESDLAGSKATPPYKTSLAYDGAGHLTTITDPAGRAYTLTWTGGHITALADQTGRVVTYGYDAENNLTEVYGVGTTRTPVLKDDDHARYTYVPGKHLMASMRTPANFAGPASAVTSMTYDTAERVTAQTDANGHTTGFAYGPGGGLVAGQTLVTDPAGHKDLHTYQNGLLVSETKGYGTPAAGTASYTYDPVTLGVTTQTDADGHVQTFTYDDHGNRTSASNALGFTTNYVYDDAGNLIEGIDPNGVATVNGYDQAGHVPAASAGQFALTSTTVTKANNVVESSTGNFGSAPTRTVNYYYDDAAHPADRNRVVNALGKTTTTVFDAFGDVTSVTDPLGDKTQYGYDTGRGWVTSTVDANNRTTTSTHDAHGRTTGTTDALNHTNTTGYDADGGQISATDANNRTITVAHDPVGQVVTVTQADSTTQVTHYNADGTITDTVDGLGAVTHYGYDAQGRRSSRTDPDGKVSSITYDPAGRVLTSTDAANRVITYAYDAAGEITSQSYSDGVTPTSVFGYDPAGHRVKMTDGTGTSTWTYDTFGEPTAAKQGSGAVVSYTYDGNGNQTSLTYPGQTVAVTRTFDDAGKLKTVTDPANKTTTFGYTKTNHVLTTAYPNGTTVTNAFDNTDAMTATTAVTGATTVLSATYGRDPVGQVSTQTVGGAPAQASTYTPREQLATAGSTAFTYDAADNPTKIGAATQAFDPAGRLCWRLPTGTVASPTCGTVPPGAAAYVFDAVGNRTKAGTTTTYGYDQAKRLTSYAGAGGSATYAYNGDGLRMSKTVGATTTNFVWGTGTTPELLSDGTTNYLYGPDGTPIEQIGPGGSAWFVHDQLGSTIGLLGATGTVGATYTYTAYGVATATGTLSTPLRFAGEYTDAESGLVYLRARYYEPTTAQFLTVDPLVDRTRAPYSYAGDNPLNHTDPSGMSFWSDLGAGLMVVGAVLAVGACFASVACGAIALTTAGTIAVTSAVVGVAAVGAVGGLAVAGGMMVAVEGLGSLEDMGWEYDGEDDEEDGYNSPESQQEQARQMDRARGEVERRLGRALSGAERRLWHDAITKQGLGYAGILAEGMHLFCGGG
ncbi:RHS repeat-associated core domain-containing protein [Actinokineospora sp. NBRC 105648]|uniref:RHS repeat-associated core domain-containing protein n=1 Tax=Actinokineospora sp. NBRC 105648 TaxID=3032206 RepID=UPI0024A202E7|nr:RHS repeat-associated core domain-containing protein [Actinokineospora sp. NBRC 105648]GLZ37140.1 type IV secretion protein Rhs [Actinokineospora sp. NBRC 105648]